jgi:hypothetical protein
MDSSQALFHNRITAPYWLPHLSVSSSSAALAAPALTAV